MKRLKMTILALLVTGVALAQGPRPNRGREEGPRKERLAEMLELSDAQKNQFEELRLAHRKSTKANKDAIKIKMVELESLTTHEVPNVKKINSLVDELNTLKAQEFKSEVNHRLELRALLDDKQKMKFDQMKKHMRGERRGRRGK